MWRMGYGRGRSPEGAKACKRGRRGAARRGSEREARGRAEGGGAAQRRDAEGPSSTTACGKPGTPSGVRAGAPLATCGGLAAVSLQVLV